MRKSSKYWGEGYRETIRGADALAFENTENGDPN